MSRLGILGSGQLAWMLGRTALSRADEVILWNPAGNESPYTEPFKFVRTLDELMACDRLIFENEFLNIPSLRKYGKDSAFFPRLECIEILQDKLNQKQLFDRLQIPTAKYWVWDEASFSAEEWLRQLWSELSSRELVFKWSRMGYDGKGNFFSNADASHASLIKFLEEGLQRGAKIYAEEKLSFDCEVALVSCRTSEQEVSLPLVISDQHKGVCQDVRGPSSAFGISESVEEEARLFLSKLMKEVKLEGCMAAEFFYNSRSGLQINELAPRVHNSGHYSLDGFELSQFDLHILAALEKSLPPQDELKGPKYFGMRNLLSPKDSGLIPGKAQRLSLSVPRAEFYWYGKADLKSLRKMGHVNFSANSLVEFRELETQVKNWEIEFWQKSELQNLK